MALFTLSSGNQAYLEVSLSFELYIPKTEFKPMPLRPRGKIKPQNCDQKASLPEPIRCKIIQDKKVDDGIEVDYGEIF
ncbi:MAG: hypothetical protein OEW45_12740 [Deltaproteobacteria bacterium]|nr:hypothetical protein [Deltaproteobacteria bacterium]